MTSTVPMVPPPPERFSTTADWRQAFCRCAASRRPITSVVPPAAAGTMMRTVSVGRQSAPRLVRGRIAAVESAAAPVRTRRREIRLVTCLLPAGYYFADKRRQRAHQGQADDLAQVNFVPRMLRNAPPLWRGALLNRGPSVGRDLGPGSAERHCVP